MTVDQWLSASGRVYRRASMLEAMLLNLAENTSNEGFPHEAMSLREIAYRARTMADRYVTFLSSGVDQ